MSRRLDIYIHRPVANARASHRVRDAIVSSMAKLKEIVATRERELLSAKQSGDKTKIKEAESRLSLAKSDVQEKSSQGDSKSFADTIRDALGGTRDATTSLGEEIEFELVDTKTGSVVETFPSHMKAKNASNKLEPGEMPKGGWRYQIRSKKKTKDSKSFVDSIRDTLGGAKDAAIERLPGESSEQYRKRVDYAAHEAAKKSKESQDDYGAAFERGGEWFMSWGGKERGPFANRAEALASKGDKSFADSIGAILIGGNEKPEDKGAKRTPLVADAKFDTLPPKDQQLLIKHFKSEFNYSDKEALEALRDSSASDLKIHLDAAKNGYM